MFSDHSGVIGYYEDDKYEHDCTGTFIKYQKKSKKQPDEARMHGENADAGAVKHDENADL